MILEAIQSHHIKHHTTERGIYMKWTQRGHCATISEVVTSRSGLSENELLNPTTTDPKSIQNLEAAADAIVNAVKAGTHISVMGDYDVDGITSSAILYFVLKALGVDPFIRLPRRMSEGYGLNPSVIPEFGSGLLITVDNGITANEAVDAARTAGLDVIILDHHLPQGTLPNANIIIDPHVEPEKNGFVEYCGAGLAYKLAQLLFPTDQQFLVKMEALAAIGTIADGMPLIGDNRVIVRNGLAFMRSYNQLLVKEKLVPGLQALLQTAEVYDVDEQDIGFKIGPMLNAAGRMRDDGAVLSLQTLIAPTVAEGVAHAQLLKEINEERKMKTAEFEAVIEATIEAECLYYSKPMCVYVDNIPEGLVGILTGRIAEKYKTPAFLLTTSQHEPGMLKGSGRSYGDYNLMDVVNAAMPFLERGGGHTSAAGISVKEENYINMVNAMYQQMESYEVPEIETLEYDLVIGPDEVAGAYKELKRFAPFGQGNPRPVFLIQDIVLSPRMGNVSKYIGKNFEHVKLHARGYSIICFRKADEYRAAGAPINLDVIGEISMNTFRYSAELQIEGKEFREHACKAPTGKPTSLMDALRRNGTI